MTTSSVICPQCDADLGPVEEQGGRTAEWWAQRKIDVHSAAVGHAPNLENGSQ